MHMSRACLNQNNCSLNGTNASACNIAEVFMNLLLPGTVISLGTKTLISIGCSKKLLTPLN